MNVRSAYLVAALPALTLLACGAERLQGAAPKLDLSIEQAKSSAGDVVDFGDVVQPNSATRRITIANSGASQLHIMNVKQTGDKVFTISTPPGDVATGKSVAFNATFKPTDILPYTGAIDFDTDDPKQAHVTVKLIGSGSDPNLVVCTGPFDDLSKGNCEDSGRVIDYSNSIENYTKTRAVKMIAATSSEVIVHSVKLVGDTQNAFKVDPVAVDTAVPGNGDLIFNVVFAPQQAGNYAAQVVIESNDPNHPKTTVTLNGIGDTDCTAFAETKTQTQTGLNKVDVLFVIDTSSSMSGQQKSITDQIATFIAELSKSNLDFNLAVTTTDMTNSKNDTGTAQGKFGTFLPGLSSGITIVHSASPPAAGVVAGFQDILNNLDADQSTTEYGMLGAMTAVYPKGQAVPHNTSTCNQGGMECPVNPLDGQRNSAFYRDDARLAIVIVSDEDDGGTGQVADSTLPSKYAQYFSSLKSDPDSMLRVVTIVDPGLNSNGCNKTSADGTPRYHALIKALGPKQGLLIDYCSDIAKSLQVSGGFIAQPDCTFDLDKGVMTVGQDNSITIEPSTVLGPGDWHYIPPSAGHPYGQVAIDKNCPAQQSQLEIDYTSCLRSYDADADTVPDRQDNCMCAPNGDQADDNSDGIGNICQVTGNVSACITH